MDPMSFILGMEVAFVVAIVVIFVSSKLNY